MVEDDGEGWTTFGQKRYFGQRLFGGSWYNSITFSMNKDHQKVKVVAAVMVKAKYGVVYGIFYDSSLNQALSKGERSKLGSVMVEVADSSFGKDKG